VNHSNPQSHRRKVHHLGDRRSNLRDSCRTSPPAFLWKPPSFPHFSVPKPFTLETACGPPHPTASPALASLLLHEPHAPRQGLKVDALATATLLADLNSRIFLPAPDATAPSLEQFQVSVDTILVGELLSPRRIVLERGAGYGSGQKRG